MEHDKRKSLLMEVYPGLLSCGDVSVDPKEDGNSVTYKIYTGMRTIAIVELSCDSDIPAFFVNASTPTKEHLEKLLNPILKKYTPTQ